MDFGANLRKIREKAQLTQDVLADKAGIHRSMVAQMETNRKTITLPMAVLLAEALDVNVSEFVTEQQETNSDNPSPHKE